MQIKSEKVGKNFQLLYLIFDFPSFSKPSFYQLSEIFFFLYKSKLTLWLTSDWKITHRSVHLLLLLPGLLSPARHSRQIPPRATLITNPKLIPAICFKKFELNFFQGKNIPEIVQFEK